MHTTTLAHKLGSALSIALVNVLSFSSAAAWSAPSDPTPCTPIPQDVAPDSSRVDLCLPTFTHPTQITNPLFPVSSQGSVLLVGRVDGQAFRTEVTLLDHTRVIPWAGMQVEVAVSQYVAFLGGRIHEVAYDLYAQDDAGNVWYFGEDVYNFLDGSIGDTHGTWIAGIDGPAAMIMPADPQPGDVYRPENIPGFVFEEVTVKKTGQPFRGPFANASGALVISELHMDGSRERKTLRPATESSSPRAAATPRRWHSQCPPTRRMAQCPLRCGDSTGPRPRRTPRACTATRSRSTGPQRPHGRRGGRWVGRTCRDCCGPCSNGRCCGSALRTRPSARLRRRLV